MQGLFSITNVKQQIKNFCKKELWADARSERCTHQRDDRAFRQVTLQLPGKSVTFTGAFHMDKQPMTAGDSCVVQRGPTCAAPPGVHER
jgi:hypothetical protein